MRFYGTGMGWDGKKDCMLVKFDNGILDTEEKRVIDCLIHAGFKHDETEDKKEAIEEKSDIEESEYSGFTRLELIEMVEERELVGYSVKRMKVDELIKLLEG